MSLDLSCIGEPIGHPSLDPLLVHLSKVFDDPAVESAVTDLRRKIVDRLITSEEELTGVDRRSEHGTFVLSGIKDILAKARCDLSSISIEMIIGSVDVMNDDVHVAVGNIAIPYDSRWARQWFINKNPLEDVRRFAFTPYKALDWRVDPKTVTVDGPGPAFLLDEREAVAAQVLMVINAAMAYRNLTVHAMRERDEGSIAGPMKVRANLDDLRDALQYAEELAEELRDMGPIVVHNERPMNDMTEIMRGLPPT